MDFELTADQLELQQIFRGLVERECPASLVRAVVEGTDDGNAFWKTLAEGQWVGLAAPEALGGGGATAVELALVLEQLGWAGDPTPFLATATQFLPLLLESPDEQLAAPFVRAACEGGSGTAAYADNTVRAARSDAGWQLHGTAHHVLDGDRVDVIAVVARTDDGRGVFLLPRDQIDASRTTTFDASLHLADVALDGVTVPPERALCSAGAGEAVDRAHQLAVTGMAMATVGASQRVFDIALVHIKQRQQFGVPIGSFQALKHMAVDVYVALERARAICQFAALTIAEGDDRRALAASMAKAAAGDCQRIAIRHGVQFFGGLGYTWENDLQLFVRRAKAGELLLGSASHHRAAVARATLAAQNAEGAR